MVKNELKMAKCGKICVYPKKYKNMLQRTGLKILRIFLMAKKPWICAIQMLRKKYVLTDIPGPCT